MRMRQFDQGSHWQSQGTGRGRNVPKLVGIFIIVLGVLFVIGSVTAGTLSDGMSRARTAKAEATIVDVEKTERRDSNGRWRTTYYPVLEFSDSDGRVQRGRQNVSSGSYEVGEVVEIEYDPQHPTENLVMTQDRDVAGVIVLVFGIIGAVLAVFGIIAFVFL